MEEVRIALRNVGQCRNLDRDFYRAADVFSRCSFALTTDTDKRKC